MRLRVSVYFSTRPRWEPSFIEWMIKFWLYHIWKPQIQIRMRPRWEWVKLKQTRQDCLKLFYLRRDKTETRQDWDETTSKILYKTGTRPRVSVLLVSRLRWNRDSRQSVFILLHLSICVLSCNLYLATWNKQLASCKPQVITCIFQLVFRNLHIATCILLLATCVLQPEFCIIYLATCILQLEFRNYILQLTSCHLQIEMCVLWKLTFRRAKKISKQLTINQRNKQTK